MKSVSDTVVEEDGEWWYRDARGRHKAKIANCGTCGEPFADFPSGGTQYCSTECRRRPCIRCGELFRPTTNRSVYCSLVCKRGTAICEGCGKQFVLNKNTAKRFCSKPCFFDTTTPIGTIRPNHSGGYLIIKVDENTPGVKVHYGPNKKGWMFMHRYVMQQKLGRALLRTEEVHHINGDRTDNRVENLELWKRSHPAGVRSADYHCPGCRCFEEDFKCT